MAPAKINLSLWVVGRRCDGYHEIITIFHKVPICDEIWVEEWDKSMVLCEGIKTTSTNTVYKALRLLSEYVGQNICLKVKIKKRIPVGSGLGGGSSDAAAVLKASNLIFKLGLSEEDLIKVGAKVGADVPFFIIKEKSAIGTGMGDILEPVDINLKTSCFLVFPSFPVSTKMAYRLIDEKGVFTSRSVAERRVEETVKDLRKGEIPALENDFEKVVMERFPEILEIKRKLVHAGWKPLMSGSGSTVFGLGNGEFAKMKDKYKMWLFDIV